MEQLINITEKNGQQVVSARELHSFLESKDHFTRWIARMLEYGFDEETDYQAIKFFVKHKNGVGGTNKIDYVLTLDTAKEISMLQRSEKGKLARQYFIACEKKLNKNLSQIDIIIQSALQIKENNQRIQENQERIERLEAKSITHREDLYTVAGWGTINNIQVNIKMASRIGRRASMLCRERGIEIDTIPDPRFGRVNVYPEDILVEVFEMKVV